MHDKGVRAQPSSTPTIYSGRGRSATLLDVACQELEPDRYERVMAASGALGAILAQASMKARAKSGGDGESAFLEAKGAAIAGQSFAAFLLWVRERCHRHGIRQVAFLARDGELFYRMAMAMPDTLFDDFRLRYLQVGRKSCMLAGVAALGLDSWRRIGERGAHAFLRYRRFEVPLAKLLERLGLTAADLPAGHPLASADPALPLPRSLDGAWRGLLDDAAIAALVVARSAEDLELVRRYLADAGLDRQATALIDVGWLGQIGAVVSAIVGQTVGSPPLTLHFGGFGRRSAQPEDYRVERFAYDDQRAAVPLDALPSCVELFLAAGQPRAVAYAERGGRVEPVLDAGVAAIAGAEIERLWAGALALVAELPAAADLDRAIAADGGLPAAAVARVFELFWERPQLDEVRVIGRMRHENDFVSDVLPPLASPFAPGELRHEAMGSRCWHAGSLLLTPEPLRSVMAVRHKLRLARQVAKWHVKARLGRLDNGPDR